MSYILTKCRQLGRSWSEDARNALTRCMIRYLLRKSPPDRIWLGCEAALQNDYYLIYIESLPNEAEKRFRVRELSGHTELLTAYSDGKRAHTQILPMSVLRRGTLDITHYYRWWRVHYPSLPVAVIKEFFRVQWFRWRRHIWRDSRLTVTRNRSHILNQLADLTGSWTHNQVHFIDLLSSLYGPEAESSLQNDKLVGSLMTSLESLRASGEIKFSDGMLPNDITITPKALTTLSDYEIEATRHADSMRIAKGQLLVSAAMVALVLATLIVRIFMPAE
ncbi:MAG: hypothetical protein KAY24_03925 [Candidatus Eisenbacteria sp.]|nr:hypothetical protein [Candidatus Eisenbacteria bacterium]